MKVEVYEYRNLGIILDPESDTKQRTVILVGKQTVKCNPRHAVIYLSTDRISGESADLERMKQYCAEHNIMLVCPKDGRLETLEATFRYLFSEYLELNIFRDELKICISDMERYQEAAEFSDFLLDEYDVVTDKIEVLPLQSGDSEERENMKKIGFIGLGIMGKSMARNLMKAGYELHIYARNRAKVEDLIREGAVFYNTIAECAEASDAVITIVGYPKDVEEVYFGEAGILEHAKAGAYVIDMTTSSPKLAADIYRAAKARGLHGMDAPVTGGDTGAREGTLSILAGGDKEDYDACHKLFEAMGTNINYEGPAGSGQHTKMVNQIMIAGNMSGVCEGISYAKAQGLDIPTVLKSVASGAAGSKQLDAFGQKILDEDYAPGFFMKHFIKDMGLAVEEAEAKGLDLKILKQVLADYKTLEEEYGDLGTQTLIKFYS